MPVIDIKDYVTPALQRAVKKADDLSPAMAQIERKVLKPLRIGKWQASGLQSRSGALFSAVSSWYGKKSAGVSIKARGGRYDKGLVFAKTHTHTFGRKKWSARRAVFSSGFRLSSKGKLKWSNKIMASKRLVRVKSPWGDIPARPFVPEDQDVTSHAGKIVEIIQEHFADVSNR